MKRDKQKDPVYYHYILNNKELYEKIDESFYEGSVLRYIYELGRKHALTYGVAPSEEDMQATIRMLDIPEDEKMSKYDPTRVKILYERASDMRKYSEKTMVDEIKTIWRWESLKNALSETTQEFRLNDDTVASDNITEIIEKVIRSFGKAKIDDFEESNLGEETMDFWNPVDHERVKVEHYSTGIEFLDIVLKGGWWPGSMHLLMGAPKSGKSMWLCDLACRSVMNGYNTVYVTLETQTGDVASRISRNMLDCTEDEYESSIEDPEALKVVFSKFRTKHKVGEFIIKRFPANTMTPQQIEEKIIKEEQKRGIKVKNVFIDYLQIEKTPINGGSDNLYLSGKRIAEESRASATRNDWCIISAIQTSKAQYGASYINETHVSESSGYNATVDSMIGLIKDPDCPGLGMYKLTVIYDRVADYQGMSKMFRFNKTHLRMEETMDPMYRDSESETYIAAKKMEDSIVNSQVSERLRTQSLQERRGSLVGKNPAIVAKSISSLPELSNTDNKDKDSAYSDDVMSISETVHSEERDVCTKSYKEPYYVSGNISYGDAKRCNPINRIDARLNYLQQIQKI